LNVNYNINYLDELYHATASEILSTVQSAESNIQTLMVVGHNFGISQLAYYLGQEACPELPTSGLMVFQFENNIKEGEGEYLHFINPKAF
jgi:phosphohistidine phosphatase SixA